MILEMLEITTEYDTCPCCHEQTVCRNTITTPDGHQRLIAGCIDPDCDNFNPAALLGDVKTLQQQNQRLQELNVEQMGQIRELQVQLADTPEQQAENNQSAWLAAMAGTHYDNLLKSQAEIKRLESENKIQSSLFADLKNELNAKREEAQRLTQSLLLRIGTHNEAIKKSAFYEMPGTANNISKIDHGKVYVMFGHGFEISDTEENWLNFARTIIQEIIKSREALQ